MRKLFSMILLVLVIEACGQNQSDRLDHSTEKPIQDKYEALRYEMVDKQIQRRGIKDSLVLNAMRKVPRHEFVPEHLKAVAYIDRPLPIGEAQTISQPYIVAIMTESLELTGGEKVLEIGTGSGYQAAILAEIAEEVYTIEIIHSLGNHAAQLLKKLDYQNVHVKIGDGYQGLPEKAPFDAIIVTAAPNHIPEPLIQQLKKGGKMIIPVGDFYQELILLHKDENNKIHRKSILPVIFVPMTGEAQKEKP